MTAKICNHFTDNSFEPPVKTQFIAEISSNHYQDLDLDRCLAFVDAAARTSRAHTHIGNAIFLHPLLSTGCATT